MRTSIPFLALTALAIAACESPVGVPLEEPSPPPAVTRAVSYEQNTLTGEAQGDVDDVFESTNEINYGNGWSHVLWVELEEVIPEQVTLDFVQPRNFLACFEYRIDDAPPLPGETNPNTLVTDGLWPSVCLTGGSEEKLFVAKEYVDVRLAYGAESNERFDWTRFYVLSLDNKDQCKSGDWEAMGFKNQGQCVRYVQTGKDSRVGG